MPPRLVRLAVDQRLPDAPGFEAIEKSGSRGNWFVAQARKYFHCIDRLMPRKAGWLLAACIMSAIPAQAKDEASLIRQELQASKPPNIQA